MLRFEGRIRKSDTSRYWLVEVPGLDIMTQGRSRKDALAMIKDAIELLVDSKGFEIKIDKGKGEKFFVGSGDTKSLIALMLHRQRTKRNLSISEVAARMGAKSKNAYAQYEQGKSEPSLTKIQQILESMDPEAKTILKVA